MAIFWICYKILMVPAIIFFIFWLRQLKLHYINVETQKPVKIYMYVYVFAILSLFFPLIGWVYMLIHLVCSIPERSSYSNHIADDEHIKYVHSLTSANVKYIENIRYPLIPWLSKEL